MPSHARGFTLIEILVVMVIVAIIAGAAVLSLGSLGRAPPARHAAEQLTALAELAAQQAVMEGRQYGLLVSRHGYRFYFYDGVRWQPVTDDAMFRARSLGDDVILELHLEGDPVTLARATDAAGNTPDSGDEDAELPKPQIALLASGEITPFEIVVSDTVDSAARYTVSGNLTQGISLSTPDSADAN